MSILHTVGKHIASKVVGSGLISKGLGRAAAKFVKHPNVSAIFNRLALESLRGKSIGKGIPLNATNLRLTGQPGKKVIEFTYKKQNYSVKKVENGQGAEGAHEERAQKMKSGFQTAAESLGLIGAVAGIDHAYNSHKSNKTNKHIEAEVEKAKGHANAKADELHAKHEKNRALIEGEIEKNSAMTKKVTEEVIPRVVETSKEVSALKERIVHLEKQVHDNHLEMHNHSIWSHLGFGSSPAPTPPPPAPVVQPTAVLTPMPEPKAAPEAPKEEAAVGYKLPDLDPSGEL